jgi:hypothetical protein
MVLVPLRRRHLPEPMTQDLGPQSALYGKGRLQDEGKLLDEAQERRFAYVALDVVLHSLQYLACRRTRK